MRSQENNNNNNTKDQEWAILSLSKTLADNANDKNKILCSPTASPTPVFFFDMDNTLYSKATGISVLMMERIRLYFQTFLNLPEEESNSLGGQYYLDYGLAIRGLVREFRVNPAEYDAFVDGGLPLERLLHPDTKWKDMLLRLNCRRWIFTNAGMYVIAMCYGVVDTMQNVC